MIIKIPKMIAEILQVLEDSGYEAYVVGGCVRDSLLKKQPKDWDITTSAQPHTVMALFDRVIPTGLKHGTVTVLNQDVFVEVTTFRTDSECYGRKAKVAFTYSLKEDLLRRDFTINAMTATSKGVPVYNTQQAHDLKNKILNTVGSPRKRFEEDWLRMLRAVRFCAQLDFTLDIGVFSAIKRLSENILKISSERIRDELLKVLASPNPVSGVRLLFEAGLLCWILPEVHNLWNFSQKSQWHTLDVFEHTLDVLQKMSVLTPDPILRLAALLHDIGKIKTRTIDENNHYHFYKHDLVGSEMAYEVCERLKLSNADKKKVVYLVEHHLDIKCISLAKYTDKTIVGFIKRNLEYLNELLLLNEADWEKVNFEVYTTMIRNHFQEMLLEEKNKPPKCTLNGNELCKLFNKEPGPWLKKIKEALVEAQMGGEVETKTDAVSWIFNYKEEA